MGDLKQTSKEVKFALRRDKPQGNSTRYVATGSVITDFRGERWLFQRISRPPTTGKGGKIIVSNFGPPEREREFYPSVFDCTIVPVVREFTKVPFQTFSMIEEESCG